MSLQDRINSRMDKEAFKNFIPSNAEEARYFQAVKRVKKIKGFYTHAIVYFIINIMIIIINIQDLKEGETYFQFQNFLTAFFWGIGLLAHGLSVFVPNWIMGQNWEERKIKEFMEKEKANKWE